MSIFTIDIYFLKHVKLHPITLGKLFNLHIGARLLATELVAGEGEDGQLDPSFAVLLVQLDQLGIVDPGLASLGGNIDQDAHLPLIFTEIHLFTINVLCTEFVNRFCIARVPLG